MPRVVPDLRAHPGEMASQGRRANRGFQGLADPESRAKRVIGARLVGRERPDNRDRRDKTGQSDSRGLKVPQVPRETVECLESQDW